jgi:transposase
MSDALEELARRLVVGHKSDGRKVFDETAKAELVALCARTGTSVSKLARRVDVNANQLSRWIREQREGRSVVVARKSDAFVALPVVASAAVEPVEDQVGDRHVRADHAAAMTLQARLPNGVVIDLHDVGLRQALEVLETLGRLRCSASTKD